MADAAEIVFLICLCVVAVVGTTLNVLNMYVLERSKTLRKKLSSVRWFMFGESLSEALVCSIGTPIMFANILVGMAPPFTTVPLICHLSELIGFGGSYVSGWYQCIIALTRLAAVVAPNWYKKYVKNRLANAILLGFPWFIGYIGYAVGALAHAYHIHPTPGSGACVANEYDETPDAARRYSSYVLSDMALHNWTPQVTSLVCYITIYTRKWWRNWNRKKVVHPTTAIELVGKKSVQAGGEAGQPSRTDQPTTTLRRNNNEATILKTRRATENERDQKIRLLAIASVVNFVLIVPCGIAFGLNFYSYLAENVPAVARLLDVMNLCAFPVNPILYMLISKDFRQAYREIFLCKSI